MRFNPLTLLYALYATGVIASGGEKRRNREEDASDEPKPTIFNGVEVPPLPDISGPNFNKTIKEGYWFVKHHSPYCPHCIHVKPTYQTLYEFYYTSKPVPAGTTTDDSATSLNTFTAYYNFHFGSLDCVAFGSTCTDNNVKAFPTFILYKDGVETKRFEGAKDMASMSEWVEEQLEAIRPGSRTRGGPKLPKPEDKYSPDFQSPKTAEETAAKEDSKTTNKDTGKATTGPKTEDKDSPKDAAKDSKKTVPNDIKVPVKEQAVVEDKPKEPELTGATEKEVEEEPLKATQVNKKPAKPSRTPNPLGKSISFTAESFQNQVTMSQEPWFIKFYAPWCGHCQAMAPTWVQLGKEMKGKLNVGEVNCDFESRLCKDVRVRSFPTILFFRGGERVEYDGLRGLGDFVSYANKAIDLNQGVKDIDAAEFKELEEKEEVIFLYFYDHATTSEDFAALERLTLSLIGHARLVKTNSALLAERFKITTWPRLLVSRDGRPTYYTALAPQEMRDFRKVLHWMQSVWLPIVPELTYSNSREIMDGKLVVLGVLSRDRPDEFAMAKKEIKSAAMEWMDRQIKEFQAERQELRDSKQLRIEEAEDRDDQRALRAAKQIRINMDQARHKEVGFAWVDGVFWERWIRTTYGIEVSKDGEKVIVNDEDQKRYWDTTISGNSIMASRTSILETLRYVVKTPSEIKAKSTISSFELFFFDLRGAIYGHPYLSILVFIAVGVPALLYGRRRLRSRRGGFFRLDEKNGLLGGSLNGKAD